MTSFNKKYRIIILFTIWLGAMHAQDGSLSPYSFFKYGDEVSPQIIHNSGMGHLDFYNDSIRYNFLIPSSLANLKYVNYSLALSQHTYKLFSANAQSKGGIFLTPYISMGIPIEGIGGVGIGFRPFSSTGFLLKKDFPDKTVAKTGEGGLNQFFISAGIKVYKGLNLGFGYDYYFGHKLVRYITHHQDVYTITRQLDDAVYTGSGFHFSADYTGKAGSLYYKTAFRYQSQSHLKAHFTRTLQLSNNAYGSEIITDEQVLRNDTVSLIIPPSYSLGIGVGQMKKWFAGIEYTQTDWQLYNDDFFSTNDMAYTQSKSFKAGGYFIPDYRLHAPYWKRITYKAGFYSQSGSLSIQNQQVNEIGITFGLSFPLGGYFTKIDVGMEYINRGKTSGILVKENIFGLKIGLSLNDKWFRKRKIN